MSQITHEYLFHRLLYEYSGKAYVFAYVAVWAEEGEWQQTGSVICMSRDQPLWVTILLASEHQTDRACVKAFIGFALGCLLLNCAFLKRKAE